LGIVVRSGADKTQLLYNDITATTAYLDSGTGTVILK